MKKEDPDNILFKGWITKEGSRWKTWKKRYAKIERKGPCLSYFKNEKSKKPINFIKLSGTSAQLTMTKPTTGKCIEITKQNGKPFFFYVHEDTKIDDWLNALDSIGVYIDDGYIDSCSDDEEVNFEKPPIPVPKKHIINDANQLETVIQLLHQNLIEEKTLEKKIHSQSFDQQLKTKQECLLYMIMYWKYYIAIKDYFFRFKNYYSMHMLDPTLLEFYQLQQEISDLYETPHFAELDDYIYQLYPNPFTIKENTVKYDPSITIERRTCSEHRQHTQNPNELEMAEV
mmetsp:Transcript_10394/g.15200  ORF Transcript_10394/g.15200 Transcript_10394/m.15200 type:complete len:286 (+) Transcript_10394:74-931(+)